MKWDRTLQAGEEVAQSKSDNEVKRDQILAHELKVMI